MPSVSGLWLPPAGGPPPPPPVKTRQQELPFEALAWENFERLCTRLAASEAVVEHAQRYGTPGQPDEGIDLFARLEDSDEYVTWQCKRRKTFGPKSVEQAVDEFLDGDWVERYKEFRLAFTATSESKKLATEFERQSTRLNSYEVRFLPLGRTEPSTRLKPLPAVVDDFFGRAWAEAFCGEEVVAALAPQRLSVAQVQSLRTELRSYYEHHFRSVDPGLPGRVQLDDLTPWSTLVMPARGGR